MGGEKRLQMGGKKAQLGWEHFEGILKTRRSREEGGEKEEGGFDEGRIVLKTFNDKNNVEHLEVVKGGWGGWGGGVP